MAPFNWYGMGTISSRTKSSSPSILGMESSGFSNPSFEEGSILLCFGHKDPCHLNCLSVSTPAGESSGSPSVAMIVSKYDPFISIATCRPFPPLMGNSLHGSNLCLIKSSQSSSKGSFSIDVPACASPSHNFMASFAFLSYFFISWLKNFFGLQQFYVRSTLLRCP